MGEEQEGVRRVDPEYFHSSELGIVGTEERRFLVSFILLQSSLKQNKVKERNMNSEVVSYNFLYTKENVCKNIFLS